MAFSYGKMCGSPLPPVITTPSRVPRFQLNCKEEPKIQVPKPFGVSRRATMQHLAAEALIGVAVLLTEPAEARVGRLENKKKVMEKLEMLRERAGESKRTKNGTKATPAPAQASLTIPPLEPIFP